MTLNKMWPKLSAADRATSRVVVSHLRCTLAAVLCLLVAQPLSGRAEQDFNFNESQVPIVEPKDEPTALEQQQQQQQNPYAAEMARCHYADSEIVLSLVLKNYNWHDLSDQRRSKVLDKLSKFFAIPKEFITMESVTKHELSEMQKESLKRGNNKSHSSRRLGRVNLILGCGSSYFAMGEPIAKQIGRQMKDGSIDNITDEKFGWWIIWRKHLKTRALRNRRQIEGSGEDDDDDYDYEENEDDEENIEESTEIPATTTHAHRHHHGASEPELTANKLLDLTNVGERAQSSSSSVASVVQETDDDDEVVEDDVEDEEDVVKNESNLVTLSNEAKIDKEIVEGVSQLESVITKTIENTKHIKELPEVVDESLPNIDVDVDVDTDVNAAVEDKEAPPSPSNLDAVSGVGDKKNALDLNSVYDEFAKVAAPSSELEKTLGSHRLQPSLEVARSSDNEVTANGNDFRAAEVKDSLSPPPTTATTTAPTSANVGSVPGNTSDGAIEKPTLSSSSLPSSTPPAAGTSLTTLSSEGHQHNDNTLHLQHHHHAHNRNHHHLPSSSSSSSSSSLNLSPSSSSSSSSSSSDALPPSSSSSVLMASTLSSSTPNNLITTSPSTTTTTKIITTANVTTNMQTKEEYDEEITFEPDDKEDVNRFASTTSHSVVEGPSTQSSTIAVASPTSRMSSSEAAVSTTTPLPDYVEPKAENLPPMIRARLQKIAVTSGKWFSFVVPEATFYDNEDMSNLRLDLTDKDGHELKPNSWLQFNAEQRQIYGLPLDDAVSRWQYRLTATDSGNESVTEIVEISVQQHRGVRTVNHEINVAVKINEKNIRYIDWQIKLINAIANTLGDETAKAIVVREIRQTPQDPSTATLVYFNETLPTTRCPESELNSLVRRLDAGRLSELVQPVLGIKSITGQLIGPCQKAVLTKPKTPTLTAKNSPPVPRNQVDRVNATVGHLLVYKVPSDTFFDPNDNELTLTLKTKEHKELSARHWLQFDSKNEEFYGIPKSGDIGSEEYMLVAEDPGGLTATDALVVVVSPSPKKEFSVHFKAYLAIKHEQFNADLQRKFVERIAQLFGDADTQNIQIRSITTHHDADGTIVNFYNTTLSKAHNRCPEEEIEAARHIYLQDYVVRERVKKALGPELNLTNIQLIPLGSCHAQTDVTHREFVPNKTEEPLLKSTFSEDYMFTVILPAVIVVLMIVVAVLVACCLHRRRRKSGKMELGDEEERKSFRTKGIPVIFQDELDEKPEMGNKSPIILKDEKPPLLPPSYNTSNLNGDNDVDEYLPPPAVVVGGREARGKSPATPSYRKPPPYVSP